MHLSARQIGIGLPGVLLAAWWLSLTGGSVSKGAQMITEEQAVAIAEQEFAKHGHAVSDYNVTIEPHYADPMQWTVWFGRKGPFPIPGGKSAVNVNKVDGHAVYMPGE
jgi:hypothetical protein